MNSFQKMHRRISSSSAYKKFVHFASPLKECGINHFWYYKITHEGHYSYIGTNEAWNEFCFDNSMLKHFTCIRHPDFVQKGISFMKTSADGAYQQVLQKAWDRFGINFNVNISNPISNGIEAFGFASSFNDAHADERVINHLPFLRGFMKVFRGQHKKLFQMLEENQVDLIPEIGQHFYERPKALMIPFEKDPLLKNLGIHDFLSLTPREKDVLKYLLHGFPALYIANEMSLSKRTVENYLANIKSKLACKSKVDLICRAKEVAALGYFD